MRKPFDLSWRHHIMFLAKVSGIFNLRRALFETTSYIYMQKYDSNINNRPLKCKPQSRGQIKIKLSLIDCNSIVSFHVVQDIFWAHCFGGCMGGMVIHHPDSKVPGANMGPIWGRQDPGGTNVGPMNFANCACLSICLWLTSNKIE